LYLSLFYGRQAPYPLSWYRPLRLSTHLPAVFAFLEARGVVQNGLGSTPLLFSYRFGTHDSFPSGPAPTNQIPKVYQTKRFSDFPRIFQGDGKDFPSLF